MSGSVARTLVEDYLALVDDSCLAVLPHVLRTAVQLGVPDRLAEWPATAEELAKLSAVDLDHLTRLLRALCSVGVLTADERECFELTALGHRLRGEDPHSVRESLVNTDTMHAMLAMDEVVRGGTANFADVHGASFFGHKADAPAANRAFVRRMQERSRRCYPRLPEAVNWSRAGTVMDIGGANGAVLEGVLAQAPHLRGVVYDVPAMAPEVTASGVLQRLPGRIDLRTGDFFESVPTGADVHIMASVLHDWNDDDAVRILRRSREALTAGGTLYVVEMLVPDDGSWHPSVWSDIGMMTLTGGRERTLGEYRDVLTASGYEPVGADPVPGSHFSVVAAR